MPKKAKKSDKKKEQENLIIPMKAFGGIAPMIAICGVLLASNKAPEMLLFLIGAGCGVLTGYHLIKK